MRDRFYGVAVAVEVFLCLTGLCFLIFGLATLARTR